MRYARVQTYGCVAAIMAAWMVQVCTPVVRAGEQTASAASRAQRPNVVIFLADDLGFSDIGCYGGEIATPNLDRLAAGGLRYRQFYNAGRCCPTRASLLTGVYPHQAGMGWMTRVDLARPG